MRRVGLRTALVAVLGALLVGLVVAPQSQASYDKDSPVAERTQRMTIPAAKFYISRQLKYQYGNVWRNGYRKTWKRCKNVSPIRVSCGLAWVSGNYIYYGKVVAYYRVADPDHVYTRTPIKRKHL